jgi:hypothetical protein
MMAKSVALLLASLFAAGEALADLTKSGAEFQINSFSDGYQREPRVAATADGEFVVVWIGPPTDGADERDVMARLVGVSGAPGAEFQINTYTTNTENSPGVAADANGNFVVVWVTRDRDGDGYGVFGQRFSADGQLVGTDFQVNATTSDDQRRAALAMSADGAFMVVWQSSEQDGDSGGVFGRRFAADASPLGTEFQVNAFTSGNQYIPQIEALTGGGFVVAWGSGGQDDPRSGFDAGVFAQRFGSDGARDGGEFQVNTYTTDTQSNVAIAARSDGGFTMVWEDFEQDPAGHGVFAQRYASSGVRLGTEFQLDAAPTGNQFRPKAGPLPQNGFVAVWHDDIADGDGTSLFARAFDANGAPLGGELQVNTTTTGDQAAPEVAAHADGQSLVVWGSSSQDFGDIIAQRLTSSAGPSGTCADPAGSSLRALADARAPRRRRGAGEPARVVTASDALAVLRTAVGSQTCALCICDVDGSGSVSATDALITLKVAVGQAIDLDCPACS